MRDLPAALVRVTRTLEEAGLPYMVIGGFAGLIWGEPRTTRDLDLTVDVGEQGVEAFVRIAGRCGKVLVDDPGVFAERARVLPIRTPEGVPVDFVLATMPFELAAIDRARLVEIAGVPVRVCGPEDLIVHKIVSERARDQEDVVGILRRQREALDFDDLDRLVEGLAADLGEVELLARYRAARRAAGLP